MPLGTPAVVNATMAWLQSAWHIHVPLAWLETCVEWVQEEGGGGRLTQPQINKQVLDQWLLADLRDLGHPALPSDLSRAQKTELCGTFCVQVDSLLDISQPAYSQLQTLRGKDPTNEEVTAVTQATQRPWEARPTRMLLLQVTDGVQNLEAMEYQPISALSTSLRPGVKLQLLGQMACRLGVLLLEPQNVKVLGGEVEDLVDRNSQGRVLRGALGLPAEEEEEPAGGAGEENPAVAALPQANHDPMEDLDDQELLASLEAQEELDRARGTASVDSGYGTGSSVTSQAHPPSSRSESSTPSQGRNLNQARRFGLGDHGDSALFDPPSSLRSTQHEEEHIPDEDFDDLPLDELDGVVFQEDTREMPRANSPHSHNETRRGPNSSAPNSLRRPTSRGPSAPGAHLDASRSWLTRPEKDDLRPSLDDGDLMDVDMDYYFPEEMDSPRTSRGTAPSGPPHLDGGLAVSDVVHRRPAGSGTTRARPAAEPADRTREPAARSSAGSSVDTPSAEPRGNADTDAAPALTSPPFTYLRSLRAEFPEARQRHGVSVRIKAFIVTLLGKLTSSAGAWRVRATVSDGTGYLDVELSDRVLVGLLGFTVAQKCAMKREPSRRAELDAGMKRCQEGMVDMCCVMTLAFEEQGSKAVVARVDPVTEGDVAALEQRVRGRERGRERERGK